MNSLSLHAKQIRTPFRVWPVGETIKLKFSILHFYRLDGVITS